MCSFILFLYIMAKELPYFKFFTNEYLTGDITMCSYQAQGLFINICCYYWSRNCNMCLTHVQQRYKNCMTELQELFDANIIKIKNENIIISFLDEQLSEFNNISIKRSIAGKKSASTRVQQVFNKTSTKFNNKDKIREDKDKDKKREEVVFPFDNKSFKDIWEKWKEYKKHEHKFNYKSKISEQAGLNELNKLSNNDEEIAIKIIIQSIANGWKGFFKLKENEKNGTNNKKNGITPAEMREVLNKVWG